MMKVILTGFEAFGGEQRNPSREIVEGLPEKIGEIEIIKLILPVVRWQASTLIREAVENFSMLEKAKVWMWSYSAFRRLAPKP